MSEDRLRRGLDEQNTARDDEGQIDLVLLLAGMLKKFRSYWWLVLLLVAACAAAFGLYKYRAYTPLYRASGTFAVSRRLLTSTGNDSYGYSYDYGTVSQLTDTFPYIVSSDLLMNLVADKMGTDYVYARIYSSVVEDTNLFTIHVEAPDPHYAHAVLLEVIEGYPHIAEHVIGDTQLSMLIDPVVPNAPYNAPDYIRYAALGALLGLMLGAGILMLFAYFNQSIKTLSEITTVLNQTPMGLVPRAQVRRRGMQGQASISILNRAVGSAFRESVRSLRTRLLRDMEERGAKVLMVTSATAGEGKSTIAMNLAISIAQKQTSVILVDADMRRMSLGRYLGVREPRFTFLDVAAGKAPLESALVAHRVEGLRFFACGHSDAPLEALSSAKFALALKQLREMADIVIVDTTPSGMLADATSFAKSCDAALFVVRQDGASKWQVIDALQTIGFTDLPILGCVLNDVLSGLRGYGHGYGYGQQSYTGGYARARLD